MPGPQPPAPVTILSQTTEFDNDEIKALGDGGNTAVVLPAQGADTMIHVIRASAILDNAAGLYTGAVTGSGWVLFTDANAGVYATAIIPIESVLGVPLASHFLVFSSYVSGSSHMVGEDDLARTLITEAPSTTPVNKPLVISDWFANGAYGGGNPANSLRVTVAYLIQNVITGQFV